MTDVPSDAAGVEASVGRIRAIVAIHALTVLADRNAAIARRRSCPEARKVRGESIRSAAGL